MSKRLWCCLVLVACGGETTKPESPASVAVSPAALDLTPGGTAQLSATPRSAAGATLTTPVTWSSSSDAVATVSTAGLVTAIAPGSATITARSGSATGAATVTVAPVPVATVSVTPATATIEVGDTTRARATTRSAAGSDLTGRTVTWTTADPSVATVAQTGLITGVTAGTTTITATSEGRSGTLALTVTPAAVATVSVTPTTGTIIVGSTRQLAATLKDARNATLANRTVSWASADPATVSISASGVVTAIKLGGPVTITATSEGQQGTLALTVTPVPAARVTVSTPTPEMNEGSTLQLTALATDSTGSPQAGRTFTWVSDSAHIATVDANGLVRAHRTGIAHIRARADNAVGSVSIVVRGLIHRWTFDEVGGTGTTFRDDVGGRVATLSAVAQVGARSGSAVGGQVTLPGGAPGLTDYVALPGGLLRSLPDATIEVWATMHSYQAWSRVFDVSGDGNLFMAWSQNATPGTDYVAFKVGTTESRIQNAMAGYTTDIQHHIVMAIDQGGGTGGQTKVTLYLDGTRTGQFDTPHTLAALKDARFWLGRAFFAYPTAHASYEEVRIHDRVYPATDIQASYRRGPVRTATPTTLSIVSPAGIGDTIRGINTTLQLNVAASDAQSRRFPVSGARWTSANANASVDSTGRVQVLSSGTVDITAMVGATNLRWTMPARHVRRLPLDPFLTTPAAGATWEIPVVIVAYIPTADARTIDVRKAPDFWDLLPFSLDTMEQRVLDYARRIKLAREQGSTFRGYKNPLALPSIGIRVTDVIVTYEHIPASTTRHPLTQGFFPDYHKIFADHGLVAYMQARGIKEVWDAWTGFDAGFPSYNPSIHDLKDIRAGSESNMASPLTGDISNSYRYSNDLPLLSHTWTMYGINIRRSQAEAIHNVGHQMEHILTYVNQRQDGNDLLFWRDFVGRTTPTTFGTGRAGWTHMPPNTTVNYGYHETSVVQSDIEDWTPANTGQKTAISRSTWYNLTYPWPGAASFGQREESQWYTYWFQNFPGRGNRIPRGSSWMTNWWAFVGDWDGSIRSGLGLYSNTQAAQRGAGTAYPFTASRAPAPRPWVHTPVNRAPRR